MNSIIHEYYPVFEMYQALRNQLMELLIDEDLDFRPSLANEPLGVLCREMGEVQQAYIISFRTFSMDFSYRHPDPAIATSVVALRAWYAQLDGDLKSAIEALDENDLLSRQIDRGGGFVLAPRIQLSVYQEALLIFYGKSSVYLKAMGKSLPKQWAEWIG